jgi:hypothetical protein
MNTMRRIILTAGMLWALGTHAQQSSSVNSGNDHGQNDCECVGIGIPTPKEKQAPTNPLQPAAPPSSVAGFPEKTEPAAYDLYYTYLRLYLWQLGIPSLRKGGK